jgi:hypothetical protein
MPSNRPRDTSEEDLEGLDEAQRAEVHEYEGGGRIENDVLVDMKRDRGEDVEGDAADEVDLDDEA